MPILERRTPACPSLEYVPKEKTKRLRWLKALELKDGDVGCHHCVCSRHFPGGDAQPHNPQLSLGKRFASPKKRWTGRAKRAQRREAARNLAFSVSIYLAMI